MPSKTVRRTFALLALLFESVLILTINGLPTFAQKLQQRNPDSQAPTKNLPDSISDHSGVWVSNGLEGGIILSLAMDLQTPITLTTLTTSARALPSELQLPPQPTQSATSDEFFYYFQGHRVPLRVIDTMIGVEFEEDFTPQEREQLIDDLKSKLVITHWQELPYLGVYQLDIEPGQSLDHLRSAVVLLRATPGILHASLAFTDDGETVLIPRHDILAQVKSSSSNSHLAEVTNYLGAAAVKKVTWSADTYLMRSPGAYSLDAANRLYESGLVEYSEPDFVIIHPGSEHSDAPLGLAYASIASPQTEEEGWQLGVIEAPQAWTLLEDIPEHRVRIAVVDTGVARENDDLSGNMADEGYNAFTDHADVYEGDPLTNCNRDHHGTGVAAVAAARTDNGLGIKGVARNHASIVPVLFAYRDSACKNLITDSVVQARAINWAIKNADVVNISWRLHPFSLIYKALSSAASSGYRGSRGSVIVAASGNEGQAVDFPANYDSVVAVGASSQDDTTRVMDFGSCPDGFLKPCGSNYGRELDLVAPGVLINSLVMTSTLVWQWEGTSFAAPQVAGVAALMLALKPQLSAAQVTDILHRTTDRVGDYSYQQRSSEGGWNEEMGFGRLNARKAVESVRDAPWIQRSRILLKSVLDAGGTDHSSEVALVLRQQDANHRLIWGPYVFRTDASGVTNTSIVFDHPGPGTYDLCAKPRYHLALCKSVTLVNGVNAAVDFSDGGSRGAWPGDIDTAGEDNQVNALDMAVMIEFVKNHLFEPGPYDFNRDGVVNTADLLKLRITWEQHATGDGGARAFGFPFPHGVDGTVITAAHAPERSDVRPGALNGPVSLGLPESNSVVQGSAFDVPITLNTNGVDTTGTTALLRYDPGLLSVQSVTMGSLYSNAVQEPVDDPVAGVVRLSTYNSSTPFNGAGVFATVRFMPHHGMPTSGVFSALQVWLEGDETYHSVVAQNVTAANQLGSVGTMLLSIIGDPRLFNGIELTPGSNSYINSFSEQIEAIVQDPYSQVRSVDFSAYYDGGWHTIETDNNAADGWSVIWENTNIADQVIQLHATAHLPGTLSYGQTNSNIVLDRTAPTYVSSSFTPPSPWEWSHVTAQVSASDAQSGVHRIEMYVNSAPDGSTSGTWDFKGTVDDYASAGFSWDTTGLEGTYQIAFAIQDNAGNWNRWDSPGLPTITYEVRRPCYSLSTNVNPAGSGTVSVNPAQNCSSGYTPSTVVQLTANANSGYSFLDWTGSRLIRVNPASITMNSNMMMTANFSPADTPTPTSTSTATPTSTPTPTATPTDTPANTPMPTNTPTPTLTPMHGDTAWTRLTDGPFTPRGGIGLAYDYARSQIVMFGGSCSSYACSDTWVHSVNDGWRELAIVGPGAREDLIMVYDSARSRTVLFGGHIWAGSYLNDTWEFDGNYWSNVETAIRPPNRSNQGMAYDAGRQRVVIFGGWRDTQSGNDVLNDTWEYDGADWTRVTTANIPARRTGTRMVYMPTLGKIVMFGGLRSDHSLIQDTWVYDGVNWVEIPTQHAPSVRYDYQLAYDPVRQRVVLFGGAVFTNEAFIALNDTWEFDGVDWAQISPQGEPPVNWDTAMEYDPSQNGIVLVGGNSPNQGNVQSWVWRYSTTSPLTMRVSIASDGTQGNYMSSASSISADGRYVAFGSVANNLVPDDTNGVGDVFVRDRGTGQTTRVSVASDGTQGNAWGSSARPSISADGRYVAFMSPASNLVGHLA